jgi:hypothetical protein
MARSDDYSRICELENSRLRKAASGLTLDKLPARRRAYVEHMHPVLVPCTYARRVIAFMTAIASARPSGAERLLIAELVARNLDGFVRNGLATASVVNELVLPSFEPGAPLRYVWPPTR